MANPKNQLIKREDTASLSNVLNEMFYEERMTLQELRFFLIYLSKINPKEPDKTEISFTLEEYAELLGVELNEKTILAVTRKLLRYVVCTRPKVLDDDIAEQYDFCQLFSTSSMRRRKSDNKWYLTFSCHDMIKEHLFDLKAEYTSLEVWNIINLNNFQDARMYMLLRQYRKIGERTIDLKELKKMLGIDINAYPEYKIFSRDVLKKCQKSLAKSTDIYFEFNAVGRPATAVHFDIFENQDYTLPKFLQKSNEIEGQLALDELEPQFDPLDPKSPDNQAYTYSNEYVEFLAGACRNEFNEHDMGELMALMTAAEVGVGLPIAEQLDAKYKYLNRCYGILNSKDTVGAIESTRFKYLCGIVRNLDKKKE